MVATLPNLRFLNSYGPTEATVGCISYLKPAPGLLTESDCPIGKPHTGTQIELLDEDGEVIRNSDAIEELAIGGAQVMRGYWQRPSENGRAFVTLEGSTFYRTGDYAYRDASGEYRFVGRRDDEIKLNGYRIHLNEICRCAQAHARVHGVVAGLVEVGTNEKELAVALSIDDTSAVDCARELKAHMATRLPAYMHPTRWALLRSFPRLPSGKVDRSRVMDTLANAVLTHDAHLLHQPDNAGPLVPLEMP